MEYVKDGRHIVSNKTLNTLQEVMYEQDHFGMDKYGVPLKSEYKYDWLAMHLEETADSLKYIQNEMDRRDHIKRTLEHACENMKWELVEEVIGLLSITGTGEHKKKTP